MFRKLRPLFHRQTSGCEGNRAGLSFLDSNQHKPQHIGNGVLFLRPFQGGNTMKALRKPLSLFMALLMCLGVFVGTGTTAFAAGETMTTYMIDLPRANDPNKAGWGHPALNFLGGWSTGENDSFSGVTR